MSINASDNSWNWPAGDHDNWTGPKGEVISLQVIPEFPIALLVLASTIGMLVIFTAKTHRLIQSAR